MVEVLIKKSLYDTLRSEVSNFSAKKLEFVALLGGSVYESFFKVDDFQVMPANLSGKDFIYNDEQTNLIRGLFEELGFELIGYFHSHVDERLPDHNDFLFLDKLSLNKSILLLMNNSGALKAYSGSIHDELPVKISND